MRSSSSSYSYSSSAVLTSESEYDDEYEYDLVPEGDQGAAGVKSKHLTFSEPGFLPTPWPVGLFGGRHH